MLTSRPCRSAASAVVLAACAGPPTAPAAAPEPLEPAAAFAVVLDGHEIRAIAELLRMEDRRILDDDRVRAMMADPSPQVRARAALAIGRVGGRRGAGRLIGALADTSRFVSASAAFALGELGDAGDTVVTALAGLATRAGLSSSDSAAVEAVAALGKLSGVTAHDALRRLFESTSSDGDTVAAVLGDVGKEAVLALWRHPLTTRDVLLLAALFASTDAGVRWRAAYALMRSGVSAGVPRLLEHVDDADPLVRSIVVRGLRAPAIDSAGVRAPARSALLAGLGDADAHVRVNALGALATHRDSTTAAAVTALVGDPDANVRIAAAQTLGSVGGSIAADALASTAAASDEPIALRAAALASLVRVAPARGVGAAASWTASFDWLERMYAARALGAAPWAAAEAQLRRLAADADMRVAAAGVQSVVTTADTAASAYALYMQALASGDVMIRAAGASGLGKFARPSDFSALMDAYARARSDTLNDASLAVIDALAALARKGMPVSRSFLLRFPRSPDPIVRQRFAAGIDSVAWKADDEGDTGRALEFYERVVRTMIAPILAGDDPPAALIRTSGGDVTIELAAADAPLTVRNFLELMRTGYFPGARSPRDARWHRVVPNFVVQDGDHRGDGSGGPGYAIRDEINRLRYTRGTVGMALSGPDTGGSQFFITLSPQPHLDGGYTVFGRVVAGMDVVDRIIQDDRILAIEPMAR